ncbi:hypothetical protein BHOIPH791_03740 [Bartonella henselae]|uniref:Uncharacterized protein n=3 Tax=Bartonella henselae TaxID=38323 RepID=A0A0H3LYF6_BARHE|nr:hypothetical protein [Bartonella henselae]ATP12364.1 hypothetical protein BhenCHDE101_04155 [Bartonella henselae]ETS07372.1 hypothetical protein Q653_01439 [Bartonella henselae JK 42]ETS08535.1 hypothetical protein Q655_00802 [Bartonella henselae JK 51]ETS09082.1 hypothetical protein Q654_00849 [Bartonella henselae JK 50]ETS12073.1 hypothetical protein Q652_01414 [Bartonella henselae JK 41]
MKERNVTDFRAYSNIDSHNSEKRNFLKKIYHSIKGSAFIGSLNGSVSGAIAAILAACGYIALPGFGPIIAMSTGIALFAGTIIGAMIGSIMGVFVGIFCILLETYIHHK